MSRIRRFVESRLLTEAPSEHDVVDALLKLSHSGRPNTLVSSKALDDQLEQNGHLSSDGDYRVMDQILHSLDQKGTIETVFLKSPDPRARESRIWFRLKVK
jgi:hypothetical protein